MLVTGQEYNALGNGGRASIIMDGADPAVDEIGMGFTNLDADDDVNHGDIASMDLILDLNPDYLFVLDKDTAVGDETPITAEQLMDNDIIAQTTAAQNGNIIYLTPGSNWYLCDGGILAMDAMIACIEDGIGL